MRVTAGHFRKIRVHVVFFLLTSIVALAQPQVEAQPTPAGAVIQGRVKDPTGKPLANADVFLAVPGMDHHPYKTLQGTKTDSAGLYRFSNLPCGTYALETELTGYGTASFGAVMLSNNETRTIDLTLGNPKDFETRASTAAVPAKTMHDAQAPQFFDEPQFTVAGVTQATNSGGHGSDTAARTTEALAKATLSLTTDATKESGRGSNVGSGTLDEVPNEAALRDKLAHAPQDFATNLELGQLLVDHARPSEAIPFLRLAVEINPRDAEGHRWLGNAQEQTAHPLEAVREYQRAAELDPSEPNLFGWGIELLAHRALEPATEVLANGNRRFPESVRMLIGLGVAWYARGSYGQATQSLATASDLDPANPAPYLFLGKMQSVEIAPSAESGKRFARFVQLQPENALANYYYAVSLWKESVVSSDAGLAATAETLLRKAIQLDPRLGPAYLQLGIIDAQRGDPTQAISAYQKAIAVTAELDPALAEMHYRLGQAYLKTGDSARGKQELELQHQLILKTKEDTERRRSEIQEFVISLQPNARRLDRADAPAKP